MKHPLKDWSSQTSSSDWPEKKTDFWNCPDIGILGLSRKAELNGPSKNLQGASSLKKIRWEMEWCKHSAHLGDELDFFKGLMATTSG